MYTSPQQTLLDFINQKVKNFFAEFPVTVHGFDHAERVAQAAKYIAQQEGLRSPFLCELAGVVHDIGRVPEKYNNPQTKIHHELSYELLKKWFQEDRIFDILSTGEKIELLYAVRSHWCDGADEYQSAIILRDADKLDMFGERGLKRIGEWCDHDPARMERDLRMVYYCFYWLRTRTARKKVEDENLLQAHDEYFQKYLREKITRVEL